MMHKQARADAAHHKLQVGRELLSPRMQLMRERPSPRLRLHRSSKRVTISSAPPPRRAPPALPPQTSLQTHTHKAEQWAARPRSAEVKSQAAVEAGSAADGRPSWLDDGRRRQEVPGGVEAEYQMASEERQALVDRLRLHHSWLKVGSCLRCASTRACEPAACSIVNIWEDRSKRARRRRWSSAFFVQASPSRTSARSWSVAAVATLLACPKMSKRRILLRSPLPLLLVHVLHLAPLHHLLRLPFPR